MIHIDRIKTGVAKYIDNEIMPQLRSWQKWVFGAAVTAYLNKADKLIDELENLKYIKMLEINDGCNIDIDAIYKYIKPQCTAPAIINIPGIGTITLTASDVEKLYDYIVRS